MLMKLTTGVWMTTSRLGALLLESTYTIGEESITPSYNTWLVQQSKLYTWESQRGEGCDVNSRLSRTNLLISASLSNVLLSDCLWERVCVCLWYNLFLVWVSIFCYLWFSSHICLCESIDHKLSFFGEPPAVHVSDRPVTHSPDGCNAAISLSRVNPIIKIIFML